MGILCFKSLERQMMVNALVAMDQKAGRAQKSRRLCCFNSRAGYVSCDRRLQGLTVLNETLERCSNQMSNRSCKFDLASCVCNFQVVGRASHDALRWYEV